MNLGNSEIAFEVFRRICPYPIPAMVRAGPKLASSKALSCQVKARGIRSRITSPINLSKSW